MANNIFQQQITPIKPKVLESERVYVYVPTATKDTAGIASFNDRDFGVNNGRVSLTWPQQMIVENLADPLNNISNIKLLSNEFVNTNNSASVTNPITNVTYSSNKAELKLNRQMRDAFARPDFVMLDDKSDFETSVDNNKYVKYTLKRNNPLEQPSLIQINPKDFIRENGIVSIDWSDVTERIDIIDTTLQGVINNKILIGDERGNFATKGAIISESVTNSIALGNGAKVTAIDSIAIGVNAKAMSNSDIAIGENSVANFGSLAVGIGSKAYNTGAAFGSDAEAHSYSSLALGDRAVVIAADGAVQIGNGTNDEEYTLKFRNYRIVDKDGKVYTNTGNAATITMKTVATEEYVTSLFNTLSGSKIQLQVVDKLPTSDIKENVIYLVPIKDSDDNKDYYEEYLYINNKWEFIGTTKIDMSEIYTKSEVNDLILDSYKHIILGADGVAEDNVYNFTVDSPESYTPYRTNGTKFLIDLILPITGDLDLNRRVAITFGDTVYYVYNILKGNEPITIGDLKQIDKYSNTIGYRFITEMTFFDTGDIKGFAIIPTVTMSDILSLTSDEMDNYLADGGLSQGQLAICSKLINNGYIEGGLYRFDIKYPDTYTWTSLSTEAFITRVTNNDITTDTFEGVVELSEAQYSALLKNGEIVINGKVLKYNKNTTYVTPDTSYSIIQGTEAPTSETEGQIGQFYLRTIKNDINIESDDEYQLYICTNILLRNDDTVYNWKLLSVEEALESFNNLQGTVSSLVPDVARALKIPMTTPIEPKLVTVNTSNAQEMINLGDELEIKNDELKLSGKVISNPNLLINGDFRVNQRGQVSYEGGNIPTVDKWYTHGQAKVDVLTDGIKVTAGRGSTSNDDDEDWTGIRYFIENPSYLSNKTFTFSVNATGSVGVWLGVYQNGTHIGGTYSTKTVNQTLSSTITFGNVIDTDQIYFRFTTRNEGDTINLYWVKLEVGSIATAFSPKSYEEELSACQVIKSGLATTYSNPNLLINGDFRINQRGQSNYSGQGQTVGRGYTVDRWHSNLTYLNFDVASKTLTNNDTTYWGYFRQYIENQEALYGKTVTFSSLVNNVHYNITTTIPSSTTTSTLVWTAVKDDNGVELCHLEIGFTNNILNVRYAMPMGKSIIIDEAKLEIGSVATAFSPRPYAEELALCQRYYQVCAVEGIAFTTFGQITLNNAQYYGANTLVSLPTTLRTKPTVSITQMPYLRNYQGQNNVALGYTEIIKFGDNIISLQFYNSSVASGAIYYTHNGKAVLDAEIY